MRTSIIVFALTGMLATACGSEHHATKFCLGADGTSQDCGIGCKIEKQKEACEKWAEKTRALCAKVTKAECQEICVKDENPTACELAKAMP